MYSYLSQGLVTARAADMLQEAEVARLIRDAKQARRRAGRPARVRRLRTAVPARRPQRAGLPAA
jgi:hypothetical protein